MQQINYGLAAITESWCDCSHNWSAAKLRFLKGIGKEGSALVWLSMLESVLVLLSLGLGMIGLNLYG